MIHMGQILCRDIEKLYEENLGVGFRIKVTGSCLLQTNCMTFLIYSENKAELFPYLSNAVAKEIQYKVVVLTVNERGWS